MPDSSDVRREIEDRLITTGVAASRAAAVGSGGQSLPRFLEDRMIWLTR
jgi:hypothetical protein